ncbi:MAG: enoyl-CoA hydratase/isomerase family protein [Candidatus Kariarchaeaceae archaeon]
MIQYVTYHNHDIPTIILDRPKNNPLDLSTLKQLIEAFQQSAKNKDKCVLYLAKGANFTVGADLKYIYNLLKDKNTESEFTEFSKCFQDLTRVMVDHPGVIIAGLHGWVVGGGFEISLSADLRIASNNTKIKLPELSIGTMFSNASTKLLSNIIGMGRAKELMFLGETIDAQRAYEIGLFNHVCEQEELDHTLQTYAHKIINETDGRAVAMAKKLINQNIDNDLETTLEKEMEILTALRSSETFRLKIFEFVEK